MKRSYSNGGLLELKPMDGVCHCPNACSLEAVCWGHQRHSGLLRAPTGWRTHTFLLEIRELMTKVKTMHRITKVICLIQFSKFLDCLTGWEKSYTLVGVCRKQGIPYAANAQKWEPNPSAHLSLKFLLAWSGVGLKHGLSFYILCTHTYIGESTYICIHTGKQAVSSVHPEACFQGINVVSIISPTDQSTLGRRSVQCTPHWPSWTSNWSWGENSFADQMKCL